MQNKRKFNYSYTLLVLLVIVSLFIWFEDIKECYETGKLFFNEFSWYSRHPGIPKKIDDLIARTALELDMFLRSLGVAVYPFTSEYLKTDKDIIVFFWLLNFGCWIIGTEFLTDSLRRSLMSKEEILFILFTILYAALYQGIFFSFGGSPRHYSVDVKDLGLINLPPLFFFCLFYYYFIL